MGFAGVGEGEELDEDEEEEEDKELPELTPEVKRMIEKYHINLAQRSPPSSQVRTRSPRGSGICQE